jgi:hypothetical protein
MPMDVMIFASSCSLDVQEFSLLPVSSLAQPQVNLTVRGLLDPGHVNRLLLRPEDAEEVSRQVSF